MAEAKTREATATIKRNNICCACKKTKKIVNVGSPPLCKDCFPLAVNWSKAYEKHKKFMMSVAGVDTLIIDTGRNDDMTYMLETMAKDIAESEMKLKQVTVCMLNICTILRNESEAKKKDMKPWQKPRLEKPLEIKKPSDKVKERRPEF